MRLHTIIENKNKITLIELPFKESDLKPIIDADTVRYHYHVLSKGYVDRYNKGEGDKIFNKSGAKLHNLFWENLQPVKESNTPTDKVKELIEKKFDTFSKFKEEFVDKSLSLQGSGWCYLSKSGTIKLIHNHKWEDDILFLWDLWEHNQNPFETRKESMKNIWKIINWEAINQRL